MCKHKTARGRHEPKLEMRIVILLFTTCSLFGQTKQQDEFYSRTTPSEIETYFAEAYEKCPDIPKHILEAMAFNTSHFYNINSTKKEEQISEGANCMGMPHSYGIFGLYNEIGRTDCFADNLNTVCKHYGVSVAAFKKSIKVQICAVASYLSYLKNLKYIKGNNLESFAEVLTTFYHFDGENKVIYLYLLNGFETSEVKVSADPTLQKYIDDNYKKK